MKHINEFTSPVDHEGTLPHPPNKKMDKVSLIYGAIEKEEVKTATKSFMVPYFMPMVTTDPFWINQNARTQIDKILYELNGLIRPFQVVLGYEYLVQRELPWPHEIQESMRAFLIREYGGT